MVAQLVLVRNETISNSIEQRILQIKGDHEVSLRLSSQLLLLHVKCHRLQPYNELATWDLSLAHRSAGPCL